MKAWCALAVCAVAIGSSAALAREAETSPRVVVEKRFEAVKHQDIEAIVALYDKDAVETSPAFCEKRIGREGVRRTYTDLFRMFPTITDDVTTYVVEGDHVAVQFIARSKKADGSDAFEFPLANFLTVKHGRIIRDDTYFGARGQPCS
jgi:ketosteroid isomerase-like protein